MQASDDLNQLLKSAASSGPGERIEFRDPIAAHGAPAIAPLQRWLGDPRLSGLAVRTLERIAIDPAHRSAVVEAFGSIDSRTLSEWAARDITDAITRIRGKTPSRGAARPGRSAPIEQWPASRSVTALELRFHDAMLDIFRLAGEATRRPRPDGTTARGYWASYFLRGVRNHGGPAYARQLLHREGTTEGFQRLTEERRLDLTMEALVLRPEYAGLFSDEERKVAAHRLAEAGYRPPRA